MEREKQKFVVPLMYPFISCFLYVPWPGIKPLILVDQDEALTNWATSPGQCCITYINCAFFCILKHFRIQNNGYLYVPITVWLCPILTFCNVCFLVFLLKKYLFIFREREGEREGEKHQCLVTSRVPPAGDLDCNPGMCPDWESNRQPFSLQASA